MEKLKSISDLNRYIETEDISRLFMICEAVHDRALSAIVGDLQQSGKRLILLAGPSSSGKTTTAKKLCIFLESADITPFYLGTDDYFIDRNLIPKDENGEQNFENLDALDIDLFSRNVKDLLDGKDVYLPHFDFISGVKSFSDKPVRLEKNQPLLIEGIHALNDALTPLVPRSGKYKIFVAPVSTVEPSVNADDVRKIRRIVRDNANRGWSPEVTLKTWHKVKEGEMKNIYPFRSDADYIFDSSYIYEPAVTGKYAQPLLEGVSRQSPQYEEACRLIEIIRKFDSISDDSCIEMDSIIREFIGGNCFR